MDKIIIPHKLCGAVTVPPSKSQAHRAVIAAGCAAGVSAISNLAFSEDIRATITAMRTLGASIRETTAAATVRGAHPTCADGTLIDCSESGSTLRFLIPLAWLCGKTVHFTGRGRLMQRPLEPYFSVCDAAGIRYTQKADSVTFSGRLHSGAYSLPGNVSSQFITGLLFALPQTEGDSTLTLTTPAESVGYIDLTLAVLKQFGITVKNHDYQSFSIPGRQRFLPQSITVEGDYSQAAFYLAANALGSHVTVNGLNEASCQGDKAICDIIRRFGTPLKAQTINVSQIPDLVPILAVLATQAEGTTRLVGAARLRLKESDRLLTTADMLNRLGAQVTPTDDALIICGKTPLTGGTVDSHNDHRIAMAAAIAATVASGAVTILGSECVAKSYANFWEDYEGLTK